MFDIGDPVARCVFAVVGDVVSSVVLDGRIMIRDYNHVWATAHLPLARVTANMYMYTLSAVMESLGESPLFRHSAGRGRS